MDDGVDSRYLVHVSFKYIREPIPWPGGRTLNDTDKGSTPRHCPRSPVSHRASFAYASLQEIPQTKRRLADLLGQQAEAKETSMRFRSESTVVKRAQRGIPQACEALVLKYQRSAFAIARSAGISESVVDDVVQQAFLQAFRRISDLRNPGAFGPWFTRIVKNAARSFIQRSRTAGYRTTDKLDSFQAAPGRDPESTELKQRMWDEVMALPEGVRDAILLYYYEGESTKTVARILSISNGAVKSRLHKGREILREKLWREMEESLRDMLPSVREWKRKGRALSLLVLSSCPFRGQASVAGVLTLGVAMKTAICACLSAIVLLAGLLLGLNSEDGENPPREDRAREVASRAAAEPPQSELVDNPAQAEVVRPAPVPRSAVSGTVRDQADNPVPSARVVLVVCPEEGGYFEPLGEETFTLERCFVTLTDDRGRFEFDGIDLTGFVTLNANKEGYADSREQVDLETLGVKKEVQLTLAAGKRLRGLLAAVNGDPVTDACVCVVFCWNSDDFIGSGGVGLTDGRGWFEVGVGESVEHCTLSVNSESLGQNWFFEIPVDEGDVRLTFKEAASLWGHISWNDGSPGEGLYVCLSTSMPEPDVLARRSGDRPLYGAETRVNADGDYEITGLCPGFEYGITVCDSGDSRDPLTPRNEVNFALEPGEAKEWNREIYLPMFVSGRVLTQLRQDPIPYAEIHMRKNGERAAYGYSTRTNKEGSYMLKIDRGPGAYQIFAKPKFYPTHLEDSLVRAYAQHVTFEAGREAALDLQVAEPTVLPIRVIDPRGKPLVSINAKFEFSIDGKRYSAHDSFRLEDEGRLSVPFYFPFDGLTVTVSRWPRGPDSEPQRYDGKRMSYVPETTIVLPVSPNFDLSGIVLEESGEPHAGVSVRIRVRFEDETRETTIATGTDAEGRFSIEDRLRAAPLTLTIKAGEVEEEWTSGRLFPSPGEELFVGEIVLAD